MIDVFGFELENLNWMNPNVPAITWWLDSITLLLSGAAAFVNLKASRRAFVEVRRVYLITGLLAAFYCLAYVWLLFSSIEIGRWSAWMNPVAIITWPVVWIWPACRAVKLAAQVQRRVEGIVDGREPNGAAVVHGHDTAGDDDDEGG